MHPTVIYIRKPEAKDVFKEIKTQLSFSPELNTTVHIGGVYASIVKVIIDCDAKPYPAIVIHALLK